MLRRHRLALALAALLLAGCGGAHSDQQDPTLADHLRGLPPELAGVPVVPAELDAAFAAAEVATFSSVAGTPVSVTVRLLPADPDAAGTVTICTEAPDAADVIDAIAHEDDEQFAAPCDDRPGSVSRVVDGVQVVVTETEPQSTVDWTITPLTAAWQDLSWVSTTSVYPPA